MKGLTKAALIFAGGFVTVLAVDAIITRLKKVHTAKADTEEGDDISTTEPEEQETADEGVAVREDISDTKAEDEDNATTYPYEISENDFYDDMKEYEKITLWYNSGIVIDENSESVDPFKVLGPDIVGKVLPWNKEAFYVRNELKQCDYELLLNPDIHPSADMEQEE